MHSCQSRDVADHLGAVGAVDVAGGVHVEGEDALTTGGISGVKRVVARGVASTDAINVVRVTGAERSAIIAATAEGAGNRCLVDFSE